MSEDTKTTRKAQETGGHAAGTGDAKSKSEGKAGAEIEGRLTALEAESIKSIKSITEVQNAEEAAARLVSNASEEKERMLAEAKKKADAMVAEATESAKAKREEALKKDNAVLEERRKRLLEKAEHDAKAIKAKGLSERARAQISKRLADLILGA
jgi:vacuolar-type H+-ATPase subunit H